MQRLVLRQTTQTMAFLITFKKHCLIDKFVSPTGANRKLKSILLFQRRIFFYSYGQFETYTNRYAKAKKMILKLILPVSLLLLSFSQQDQNNTTDCLLEKVMNLTRFDVQCTEEEKVSDNELDPILIKICQFKNFESVRTGIPDYKGRYSYEYDLYKVDKEVKEKIKNSDLFRSGVDLVEKRINQDLQQEYQKNKNDPHLKDCMEWINFRHYTINEMGMAFTNANEIEFFIDYGISGACFNVAHSILRYQISEFAQYLE